MATRRRHGGWEIVLQHGTVPPFKENDPPRPATFLTTPVVNAAKLEFTVYRGSALFGDLLGVYGFQDIQIGDAEFDRQFICKGSDEAKMRQVFSDQSLRSLLGALPDPVLTLTFLAPNALDRWLRSLLHRFDPARAGEMERDVADKLQCYCMGVLEDAATIAALFALFERMLDRLAELGFARPSS